MSSPRHGKATFAAVAFLLAAHALACPAVGQNDGCDSMVDKTARAECLERSRAMGEGKQAPIAAGEWRLLRTPSAPGRADEVSLTHTPEASRSDPNLAGMMLHCHGSQVEVLLVVIEPYPPQTPIEVTIRLGKNSPAKYRADVAPSGLVLRLPVEAAAPILASTAEELLVQIAGGIRPAIDGVIKLEGLGQAAKTLKDLCARL